MGCIASSEKPARPADMGPAKSVKEKPNLLYVIMCQQIAQ